MGTVERGERCGYAAILCIMILYYKIFYYDILLMFITDYILLILIIFYARSRVCVCARARLCVRVCVLLMHIADVVVIFFSLRAIFGPLDSARLERGERCGF